MNKIPVTRTYPIIEQKTLDIVRRRWLRKRSRPLDEMLKPTAHQVLVYQVGDQLIVDSGARRVTDGQVVDATSVSLVDMTVGAPVLVELTIPADSAAEFTLHVTFECTVTDALTVVRNGKVDARTFLGTYLRSMPDLADIGQKYRIDQVKEMRNELITWLTSYVINDPPKQFGMRITMVGAQVLTPDELAEFEKRRRDQMYEDSLTRQREDNDAARRGARQSHQHVYDGKEQRHELDMRAERNQADLDQMQTISERVGSNPLSAMYLALATGGMDSREVANILREQAEVEIQRKYAERQAIRKIPSEIIRDLLSADLQEANIHPEKVEKALERLVETVGELVAKTTEPTEAVTATPKHEAISAGEVEKSDAE
ncbi:hypothetical protein [Nocardia amamiensis]|uniref:hypothetical protein n=1 Tax=Nocardia amamiensis TaxID=404578 RepID=UPI0008345722|nr:hypothetical protein [Nocardia amamiensis]